MILTIDMTELASYVKDDLRMTKKDFDNLRNGVEVPFGWTNAVMDRLQDDLHLEDILIEEILKMDEQ